MEFLFISLLIYITAFLQFMSKLIIFMLKKKKKTIKRLKRFTSKEVLKELKMHSMAERGLRWDISLQIFKESKYYGQKGSRHSATKGGK